MIRRFLLASALLLVTTGQSFGDMIVFSENMGTPTGTTAIASNVFQNSATLSFSGTGDVRITAPSTSYTGASGGGNIFLTNTSSPRTFQISNINTSAFVAGSLDLSFGALKTTSASNFSELVVAFSTDGSTFTNLTGLTGPSGTGTANIWTLFSVSNTAIPISSTLTLRFSNTSTTPQFRIDDVVLRGDITAVPEPSSLALVGLVGFAGLAMRRRRKAGVVA